MVQIPRGLMTLMIILTVIFLGAVAYSAWINEELGEERHLVIIAFFSYILIGVIVIYLRNRTIWIKPRKGDFPERWKKILREEVPFYAALDSIDKSKFEYKAAFFLLNHKIVGVETKVESLDRMLIASGAVIPTFNHRNWKYRDLDEVLLYPRSFFFNFPNMPEGMVMDGLVGSGPMEGKMILSQTALREGFRDGTDNANTALHEFVHLIDKADGEMDGVPSLLMKEKGIRGLILWSKMNKLFHRKALEIKQNKSDIRPYGSTNKAEFLSVATEYFFENPKMMQEKHPDLHRLMERIYQTPKGMQQELSRS